MKSRDRSRRSADMGKRIVKVSDAMQKGYRYELTAPAGRNFDPEFLPELTPKQMLRLGVFCGKYMTDTRKEFPPSWFVGAKLRRRMPRLLAELLRRRCQPAAFGMAPEGMDSSRRSARLVSMVLPLLHGPPAARRGSAADRTLEGDAPAHQADPAPLRAGRSHVPQAPAAGAAALGLRQPQDLMVLRSGAMSVTDLM